MAAQAKRFYELRPGWLGGTHPLVEMDGWSLILTQSVTFEFMETWYEDEIPSSAKLETKPRQRLPELILSGGDAPIVSAKFKVVVEEAAPGAAEFRPFSLRWEDESPVPGEWHLCNLLRRVDCINFEFMRKRRPRRAEVEAQMKDKRTDPMTDEEYWLREGTWNELLIIKYIDSSRVGDAQIWRPRWHPMSIFITDGMRRALKKAGVAGLHVNQLGTREEPLLVNPPHPDYWRSSIL